MIVTCDIETFWDKDYSLTKMSTVEYVLDPRFELILLGIKIGSGPVEVARGEAQARLILERVDWNKAALLSHNTMFDGSILAWRFNIIPRFYLDTLAMARAVTHAYTGSSSLENLARHFQFAPKGVEAKLARGRWLASFTKAELDGYASYCAHDVELCRLIFDKLIAKFPRSELVLIDLSLRKFFEPQAKLNTEKLALHLAEVRAAKETALQQVSDVSKKVFASNPQFASLLAREGVKVPIKISPITGEETFALARNDPEFKQLCEDPNQTPRVQTLLAVRLGVKSTIEETRSEMLLRLSSRDWSTATGNACGARWMPVPYNYYGAHTGRFSGAGGFNFTNLKRKSKLRDAIEIPDEGWRIVHRDSSQIEARIVAWLAECQALLDAFAAGDDIYSQFASIFYQRTITRADTLERFVGKTCILGLGYGASGPRIKQVLFIGSGGVAVNLSEDDAQGLVDLYRTTYREIPRLWRTAQRELDKMVGIYVEPRPKTLAQINAAMMPSTPPRLQTVVKRREEQIVLPNKMSLKYLGIRQDGTELIFGSEHNGYKKIYGAKLIENITQALARIVVTDIELRVWRETGYRPFMSTYDSHDYMVPVGEVAVFDRYLEAQFTVVPEWGKGLPLASEGGWGKTLLDAENQTND